MTFKTPHAIGDVLLLILLLPVACAALAFLFMFPLMLAIDFVGAEVTQDGTLIAMAVPPAVVVILWLTIGKMFWTLTLAEDGVVFGRWLPRRVSYDRILFVLSGPLAQPLVATGAAKSGAVPLTLTTGLFRKRRIFLTRGDADRCLRELCARCPNASGIDMDGTVYPPRAPGAIPYGRFRLAKVMAIRGLLALGIAAALPAALVFYLIPSSHQVRVAELWQPTHRRGPLWGILVLAASFIPSITYGTRMLRRARLALSGVFEDAEALP